MAVFPLMTESQLIGKDPDAGRDWGQEEKGVTEDEMVGWHHRLNGCEFEQIPENIKDREAWCAAVHGFAKTQTRLSDWTTKTSNTWEYFKPEVNNNRSTEPALCANMHFAYNRGVGYHLGVSQSFMNSFCCRCHNGNYTLLLWNVLCTPERGNVSVREPNLPPPREEGVSDKWIIRFWQTQTVSLLETHKALSWSSCTSHRMLSCFRHGANALS